MRLDAGDFEAVWQHMCARALADHAQGTLIASFVKEDGHWIQAVQPERLRVTSRIPRGKSARALPKALFPRDARGDAYALWLHGLNPMAIFSGKGLNQRALR